MRKYAEEFKLSIVKQHATGRGYKQLSTEHGLSQSLVRRWVRGYQEHGQAALRSKPRIGLSARFKEAALKRMWSEGLSHHETAVLFDIRGQSTIGVWERQYRTGGIKALEPRRQGRPPKNMPEPSTPKPATSSEVQDDSRSREQLLEEIEYLRAEVAYLKKLDALVLARKRTAQLKKRK